MKQTTIGAPFSFEGKGLHTGLIIHATFRSASENSGIRICRIDLPGRPTYQALAQYVTSTERGTVLENGDWRVSTVEHGLSALYAMGITNCLIEVDAPEFPILDGSAKPYVDAIRKAGIVEQEAEAKTWVVKEPVSFTAKCGSTYLITPAEEPIAHIKIEFPGHILHNQEAELLHLSDYPEQIAYARTFCFVREIQPLLQMGLIKGGDLQNALVIYEKEISQAEMDKITESLGAPYLDATRLGYLQKLHFENEPARHKLLDLIGDFSLLGVRIQGRISAVRPGHGPNTEFAKQLLQDMQNGKLIIKN